MRIAIVTILSLVAATSRADPPRYTRKQDLKLDVKPRPRAKAPRRPATGPARPVTADDALAIEELVDPIRKEQEIILLELIRDTPDSDPDKPDYLFRLAEQYSAQQRLWRLKAIAPTVDRYPDDL